MKMLSIIAFFSLIMYQLPAMQAMPDEINNSDIEENYINDEIVLKGFYGR